MAHWAAGMHPIALCMDADATDLFLKCSETPENRSFLLGGGVMLLLFAAGQRGLKTEWKASQFFCDDPIMYSDELTLTLSQVQS